MVQNPFPSDKWWTARAEQRSSNTLRLIQIYHHIRRIFWTLYHWYRYIITSDEYFALQIYVPDFFVLCLSDHLIFLEDTQDLVLLLLRQVVKVKKLFHDWTKQSPLGISANCDPPYYIISRECSKSEEMVFNILNVYFGE